MNRIEQLERFVPAPLLELWHELRRIEFINRSFIMAARLFIAVIPLSIIISAVGPDSNSFGDDLVLRFGLEGEGASATRELFATSGTVRGALGVLGAIVIFYSLLSFTRGLQAVYLDVWQLRPQGLIEAKQQTKWVFGFIAYLLITSPIRSVLRENGMTISYGAISTAIGAAFWLWTPYVLLGKRVAWRRLLPTGIITAVSVTIFLAACTVYLPRIFSTNAHFYGLIGVAFALVSWLLVYAFVVIVSLVVGRALDRRVDRSDPVLE